MSSEPSKRPASSPLAEDMPEPKRPRTSPSTPEPVELEAATATSPRPAPVIAATTPAADKKSQKFFEPWTPAPPAHLTILPTKIEETWGVIPYPGPEGPQPHPNSPSARESDAQTNPPLWEDRKCALKPGRYQKSFGPGPANPEGTDLDQEDLLVLRLIEMRPIRSGNNKGQPARKPKIWYNTLGKPIDYTDIPNTLHVQNTRRRDNVRSITCDPPWTRAERRTFARLIKEFPDASITELAERHNFIYKGNFRNDIDEFEDVASQNLVEEFSQGRTTESFRHEYLTWRHVYEKANTLPEVGDEEYEPLNIPQPQRSEKHRQAGDPRFVATVAAFERWWVEADRGTKGFREPMLTRSQKKAAKAQKARERRQKKLGLPPKPARVPKVPKAPKAPKKAGKAKLSEEIVVDSPVEDGPAESSPHGLPEDVADELLNLAGTGRSRTSSFSSNSSLSEPLTYLPSPEPVSAIREPFSPKAPHSKLSSDKKEVLELAGLDLNAMAHAWSSEGEQMEETEDLEVKQAMRYIRNQSFHQYAIEETAPSIQTQVQAWQKAVSQVPQAETSEGSEEGEVVETPKPSSGWTATNKTTTSVSKIILAPTHIDYERARRSITEESYGIADESTEGSRSRRESRDEDDGHASDPDDDERGVDGDIDEEY